MKQAEENGKVWAWCPQCWVQVYNVRHDKGLECSTCHCIHKDGNVVEDGWYPCRCCGCGDRSSSVMCDECMLESD